MKGLRLLILLAAAALLVIAYTLAAYEPIRLEAAWTIEAGAAWSLDVHVTDAEPGDTVQLSLVNGLQVLDTVLTLGSGSVARWDIPAERITQAGESLLLVRQGEDAVRRVLQVQAGPAADADLYATSNSLSAYGEGISTLLLLPRDAHGNPPPADSRYVLNARYPDSTQSAHLFHYTGGLAWYDLRSRGDPGRVRLALTLDAVTRSLELTQTPGTPHRVTLTLSARCLPADGRDLLTLNAHVTDAHDNPVVDGTLVRFSSGQGIGYGRTADGAASLRLPAPTRSGLHIYQAMAGLAGPDGAVLRINAEGCAHDD